MDNRDFDSKLGKADSALGATTVLDRREKSGANGVYHGALATIVTTAIVGWKTAFRGWVNNGGDS